MTAPAQDAIDEPKSFDIKSEENSSPEQKSNQKPEVVEVDGEEGSDAKDSPPALNKVDTAPYNHQKVQEIARRIIALSLIALVFFITILSFIYLFVLPLSPDTKKYVENLVLLLQVIFGPIITLAGTAIGYYFGANGNGK